MARAPGPRIGLAAAVVAAVVLAAAGLVVAMRACGGPATPYDESPAARGADAGRGRGRDALPRAKTSEPANGAPSPAPVAYRAKIDVSVVRADGTPVAGATVTGTFSGSYSEAVSGTTGANGAATLTTAGVAKGGVSFQFFVDSVSYGPLAYQPADNRVTCSRF